jgi:hypothetical protein
MSREESRAPFLPFGPLEPADPPILVYLTRAELDMLHAIRHQLPRLPGVLVRDAEAFVGKIESWHRDEGTHE